MGACRCYRWQCMSSTIYTVAYTALAKSYWTTTVCEFEWAFGCKVERLSKVEHPLPDITFYYCTLSIKWPASNTATRRAASTHSARGNRPKTTGTVVLVPFCPIARPHHLPDIFFSKHRFERPRRGPFRGGVCSPTAGAAAGSSSRLG